jgi:hypothetical protein
MIAIDFIRHFVVDSTLAEVLRNPPELSSFLLGFAGTLLTGLAILREKKQALIKTEKSERN